VGMEDTNNEEGFRGSSKGIKSSVGGREKRGRHHVHSKRIRKQKWAIPIFIQEKREGATNGGKRKKKKGNLSKKGEEKIYI